MKSDRNPYILKKRKALIKAITKETHLNLNKH